MAMLYELAGAEYLCQMTKLHLLQGVLQADLVLDVDPANPADQKCICYVACYADQTRLGPSGRLSGAWRSWCTNSNLLWRWWEIKGRWGWAGAHWVCLKRHGILWWKRVHNHYPRIISPLGIRRMAPPQASPYPLWPLPLACHLDAS